jgi:C4-dicarboxylate-specific signal transduction histidine kinase
MPPSKTGSIFNPAMIFIVLATLFVTSCTPKEPPLSTGAQVFKNEVGRIVHQMQQSLADPTAQGNAAAIDAVLNGFSKNTAGMCVDCPYRTGVLNKDGVLLTTFPKNELIGRNFSSYKTVSDALKKEKITQRQIFQADGEKIYFISAPLIEGNKVVGVVLLALTPADLEKKWNLTDKEFLAIDFNTP